MDTKSRLGQLPQASHTHDLQTLSFKAFENIMPEDMFIIRRVQEYDYGVDLQIEAKVDRSVTNFTARVQVKSTDSTKKNVDGSISVEVDVSNLNYLLNSPLGMGIYVLYLAQTQELKYEWVLNEYKRFEKENPNWKNQQNVNLRLAKKLDSTAVSKIHQEIIDIHLFHRDYLELLAQKEIRVAIGRTDIPRVIIDTQTLSVTDATESLKQIINNGINLVADGEAQAVLRLAHNVPYDHLMESKAQLALAYANYAQGHFIQCEANIAGCRLDSGKLKEHEEYLLVSLENACTHNLGEMSREEFLSAERASIDKLTDPALKLQAELYHIRASVVGVFKGENIDPSALQQQCRNLIARAQVLGNPQLQVLAQISLLEIEGQKYLHDFVQFTTLLEGRINLGLSRAHVRDILHSKLNSDLQKWKARIDKLTQSINDDRLLFADAILTGGKLLFGFVFHCKYLSIGRSYEIQLDLNIIDSIIAQLEQAADVFLKNNMRHDEVRAKMLMADYHYFVGRTDEAKSVAEKILPKAKALQYALIVEHLEKTIEGKTDLDTSSSQLLAFQKQLSLDEDFFLPSLDDDQLRVFSQFVASVHGVPESESNVVFKDFVAMRAVAQERRNWCKHMNLEPATISLWKCRCPPTGFLSSVIATEPESVLSAFKSTYCTRCSLREPKSN